MFPSSRFMHRLSWGAVLCGALIGAPNALAAQQPRLADSLTDRDFWRFFTTMSEESGTFPSENFVSNEKMYQYVIPTLQRTLTPKGVYLGVGPEQNFTYIVNLKPRMAVIFDIRRQNAMIHLMYKALFELSPTRAEFVAHLFSRPMAAAVARSATPAEIFAGAAATPSDSSFDVTWKAIVHRLTVTHGFALSDADLEAMRRTFIAFSEAGPDISYAYHVGAPPSPTPWLVTFAQLQSATNADGANMAFLATEENYQWLRALESKNMVVPVVGDFGGPKAIRSVGEYLRQRGAIVTAFYVSNVEQYLFSPGFGSDERFYQNVGTLPIDSTSRFIRSLPPGNPGPPPLPPGLVPPNSKGVALNFSDSGGVRVWIARITDSTGNEVLRRVVGTIPPVTVASTSAFISGIAPIRRVLDAFASGQLKTYGQVNALTKTDGWDRAATQTPGESAASARLSSLLGDSTRLLDFLRAMPKGGDLHNHLTGSIRPESWVQWAAADGYCYIIATSTLTRPPCDNVNRLPATRLVTDSALGAAAIDAWSMRGWRSGGAESGADHFFATFSKTAVVNLSRLGDMLAEATSRAAAQHVSYLELMINLDDGSLPRLGARVGWNADFATMRARLDSAGLRDSLRNASRLFDIAEQRQRALLRCGTPAADAGCGVTVRYVYQAIRSRTPEQVFAQLLGGLEWPAIDRRYVSLNLVAPEHGDVAVRDFDLHMRMLDYLRASHPNVPITLHAGELSERVTKRETMRSHIRESIEVGHAVRIGHGVDVLQEDNAESLLREMAARHVLVEIGLTSNDVILGVHGSAHPLAGYLAHGVPVALVTDDEGVSLSDMTHEYFRAATDQHLDYRTLKSMARNSITYSFADDTTKTRLRSELEKAFTRFEAR